MRSLAALLLDPQELLGCDLDLNTATTHRLVRRHRVSAVDAISGKSELVLLLGDGTVEAAHVVHGEDDDVLVLVVRLLRSDLLARLAIGGLFFVVHIFSLVNGVHLNALDLGVRLNPHTLTTDIRVFVPPLEIVFAMAD